MRRRWRLLIIVGLVGTATVLLIPKPQISGLPTELKFLYEIDPHPYIRYESHAVHYSFNSTRSAEAVNRLTFEKVYRLPQPPGYDPAIEKDSATYVGFSQSFVMRGHSLRLNGLDKSGPGDIWLSAEGPEVNVDDYRRPISPILVGWSNIRDRISN